MRKSTIFLLVIMMMVAPVYCFAQSREASGVTLKQSRTNMTSLALTGMNTQGAPGYLVMTATTDGPSPTQTPEYFLWVDASGDLCMASHATVYNDLSTDSLIESWEDVSCTKVGGQS